ncbi:MAG: methyltransferase domain-containing protein [Planctomycetes bacterium]|nr:methyltransferase domain-containing protein [Planctomycetota bacterium]
MTRPFLPSIALLLPLALACAAAPIPGAQAELNAEYRRADLDVQPWVERFEGKSREIAACREALVAALAPRPGEAVADVGAGTGLFIEPLARAVGPQGTVFAVDIAPAFLEHIRARAAASGLTQVRTVLCDDRGTGLAPASVDAAFVCDTYHHLEHPSDTLASLHAALRKGGRLLLVDFERAPGVSRDWVLDHVRAGQEQVTAEVEAAGFRLVRQVQVAGLVENYVLEFVR